MQVALRTLVRGLVLLSLTLAFGPQTARADIYAWYILSSLSGPGTGVANVVQGGKNAPLILEMEPGTEPVQVTIRFIADIPEEEGIIAYANDLIAPDSDHVVANEVRFLADFGYSYVAQLAAGPGVIIDDALELSLSANVSGRIGLFEFDLEITPPESGDINLFTGIGSAEWADMDELPPIVHFADSEPLLGWGGEVTVSSTPSIIIRNYVAQVDCDGNGLADSDEIAQNSTLDCNANGTLDSCELANSEVPDCNHNGKPDSCDIAGNVSLDANSNGVPDECDPLPQVDCNSNGLADADEIAQNATLDCNHNAKLDSCDIATNVSLDANSNGVPDECDTVPPVDCNGNGLADADEIAQNAALDCNQNGSLDSCELTAGTAADCNFNNIPDSCDTAWQNSTDFDANGVPDECEQPPPVNPIPPVVNATVVDQPTDQNTQTGHLVNRDCLGRFLKFMFLLPEEGDTLTPVARMTMRTFGFVGLNVAFVQGTMELLTLPQRMMIYNLAYGVLDAWLP